MPAYVVYSQAELRDPDAIAEYRRAVGPVMEKYGATVLGADSDFEVLEGATDAKRVVVIQFPDMDTLKRWYTSDDYKPLAALRQKAALGTLIAVAGAG